MKTRDYMIGADVLGVSAGDFVPWLGVVSKALGSFGGGGDSGGTSQQAAIEAALAKERERQRMEAEQARTRTIMYVLLAGVGLGGAYLITRRK